MCTPFSVKAMLLIIDCKKKLMWKKVDRINVLSSEGKIASEEKELLKTAENGEVMDKVMDEVMDELLVSIKLAILNKLTTFFHGLHS